MRYENPNPHCPASPSPERRVTPMPPLQVDGAFFGELPLLELGKGELRNRHVYDVTAVVTCELIYLTRGAWPRHCDHQHAPAAHRCHARPPAHRMHTMSLRLLYRATIYYYMLTLFC